MCKFADFRVKRLRIIFRAFTEATQVPPGPFETASAGREECCTMFRLRNRVIAWCLGLSPLGFAVAGEDRLLRDSTCSLSTQRAGRWRWWRKRGKGGDF